MLPVLGVFSSDFVASSIIIWSMKRAGSWWCHHLCFYLISIHSSSSADLRPASLLWLTGSRTGYLNCGSGHQVTSQAIGWHHCGHAHLFIQSLKDTVCKLKFVFAPLKSAPYNISLSVSVFAGTEWIIAVFWLLKCCTHSVLIYLWQQQKQPSVRTDASVIRQPGSSQRCHTDWDCRAESRLVLSCCSVFTVFA